MESNIREDATDESSIRLWFQAMRRIPGQSSDAAIERLSYWKANSDSIDARFYLFILHSLRCMDGNSGARDSAQSLLRECRTLAQGMPNRHYAREWFGTGTGLKRIVPSNELGEWEQAFDRLDRLALVEGRIISMRGPESGEIELTCGLKAFFVPARGHRGSAFYREKDENAQVRFCLAFAYDGLVAWATRGT